VERCQSGIRTLATFGVSSNTAGERPGAVIPVPGRPEEHRGFCATELHPATLAGGPALREGWWVVLAAHPPLARSRHGEEDAQRQLVQNNVGSVRGHSAAVRKVAKWCELLRLFSCPVPSPSPPLPSSCSMPAARPGSGLWLQTKPHLLSPTSCPRQEKKSIHSLSKRVDELLIKVLGSCQRGASRVGLFMCRDPCLRGRWLLNSCLVPGVFISGG